MQTEIQPEKKKNQPSRRRLRLLLAGLFVMALLAGAGALVNHFWQQYRTFQKAMFETASVEKFFSPSGKRYVGSYHNPASMSAFDQTTWLVDTSGERAFSFPNMDNSIHAVHWSADERYVTLNASNHYSAVNLKILDMETSTRIMPVDYSVCITMGPCTLPEVMAIAPATPRVITSDGTMINLPDGTNYKILEQEPQGIVGGIVEAFWSSDEQHLFLLLFRFKWETRTATLTGMFGDGQGYNLAEVFTADYPVEKDDSYVLERLNYKRSGFCYWQFDEEMKEYGVDCTIVEQTVTAEIPPAEAQ